MSEELRRQLDALLARMEALEKAQRESGSVREMVAEIKGQMTALQGIVEARFDQVDTGVSKASSWDTALKFAGVVVIPVLLTLIGGYIALKSGVQAK